MASVVLYIATSLDGYIAKPDGNLDWLTSFPLPEKGDYGYESLLKSIGTIIMGRKTYEDLIGFGIDWPYTEFATYVITRNKELTVNTPNTTLHTDNFPIILDTIKEKSGKDIWLVGGGEIVSLFLNQNLIDKMIISVIPMLLGAGIPLFQGMEKEANWELAHIESFETGVVNLTYNLKNENNN